MTRKSSTVFTACLALVLSACGASQSPAPERQELVTRAEPAQPAPLPEEEGVLVCDQRYWFGEEGNRAVAVFAKFNSLDHLSETLELSQSLGEFQGRTWTLADVLLDVDLNANGHTASWRVSGPQPLIGRYIEAVRQLQTDRAVYDLMLRDFEVVTTAHIEGDEG